MITDEQLSHLLHRHTPEPPTLLRPETLMEQREPEPRVDPLTTPWAPRPLGRPAFVGTVVAAAVVAGVVAGSVAVANRRDTAIRGGGSTAATSPTTRTTTLTPVVGYSTTIPAWLPPGVATLNVSSTGLAERAGRVEYRDYSIRSAARTAVVQIDLAPGASLPAGPSQGVPWRDLTIGKYPARQWSGPTWNWVKILHGHTVVTIDLHSSHTTAATLRDWARHVAIGLRYNQHERVRAAFNLGRLAGGLHPVEVSAGTATVPVEGHTAIRATTSYTLSRTGVLDNVVVMLIPHQVNGHTRINKPGRPVQGRATFTSTAGATPALRIARAVGGQDITIFAEFPGARGATLAQLYSIAAGLVLHS